MTKKRANRIAWLILFLFLYMHTSPPTGTNESPAYLCEQPTTIRIPARIKYLLCPVLKYEQRLIRKKMTISMKKGSEAILAEILMREVELKIIKLPR
jgi:hypothetical protein